MAGDRVLNRHAVLPLGVQYQLRETLFPSKITPVVTRVSVASGSVLALSGSNAEGRIGMMVTNITAFADAQSLNIGFASADVDADDEGWPLRGRTTTSPDNLESSVWLPLAGGASGTQAFMAAQGATQTVVIVEW